MRVCLLTPEFLPTWGGVGTYTYNLARALRDRAEVHVVTSARGRMAAEADDLDGVQVHVIEADGARPDGLGLAFQLAVLRRLPGLAKAYGFDIVHANHAYMSDLLARRRLSAIPALTVHTTLGTQIQGTLRAGASVPRNGSEGTVARWRLLLSRIERRYLRRTPALIYVSRWVRDNSISQYGLQPRFETVIPNGVDTARLDGTSGDGETDPRPDDSRTLLFAGRLLALKGIDTLLRALGRLDPEVRLLLAGPGDTTQWTRYADRLGVGRDRYEFLGPVPYGSMPALYHRADAVVLPSFAESCPMVALEAMACGTPLIAARAGGVTEIVRDGATGWLFPPGDVDGLVDRIETVFANPARAEEIANGGRDWVERNGSVDRMAERTFRFYKVVAGEAS